MVHFITSHSHLGTVNSKVLKQSFMCFKFRCQMQANCHKIELTPYNFLPRKVFFKMLWDGAIWLNLITPFRPPDFPTQKQYPTLKGSLQNLQSIFSFSEEVYSFRKESYLYIAIGSAQYESKTNEIISNYLCTILHGRFQNFLNDISSGELNISS